MTNKYQSGQEQYEKPADQVVEHPSYLRQIVEELDAWLGDAPTMTIICI